MKRVYSVPEIQILELHLEKVVAASSTGSAGDSPYFNFTQDYGSAGDSPFGNY